MKEENNPYDSPDYALSGFMDTFKKNPSPEDREVLTKRFATLDPIEEEKSSTERVRKYYKRHPEKVRKYLKDTVKDRAARNRDRRKAIKKHGKAKMKNHDVHHPKGPNGGSWRLAKKDHGRDKINELFELVSQQDTLNRIQKFVQYAAKKLHLKKLPTIKIKNVNSDTTSLGHFEPDTGIIYIVTNNRLLADILRTVAHELVHVKQMEMGRITNPEVDGKTGSPIENEANTVAGVLMRGYGKKDRSIFLSEGLLSEGGADGVDYVKCQVCNQKLKQIQYRHLNKHNMTMEQYIELYPSAKLVCENSKNYMSTGKNPMKNAESRQKISEALAGTHKCAHFGDKNPMKRFDVREKFMGDNNPSKTETSRKKISEGVMNSYTDELKKIRSSAFKKIRNSDNFREKMYELKLWTRTENKPSRDLYESVVRNLSNVNYQEYFYNIPNAKKRSREWHLDHKISIQYGFDNQIHPAIIAHPCNLEILHHSLNESKGIKNSILYEELLELIGKFDELHGERVLLMCGGAAGHLAHPFEDEELTFADMKEMINRGLLGGLDQEAPVTEKLDGQNIAFSIRDGQIVFARNKGHLKNRGKNALDVAGIRQMFSGRGGIEKAFTGAAEDLQAAVAKLSPEQVQQMFGDGSKFMSLEVILPDTQNVIPYGKSVLVMHGTIEYDEDGNEIGRSSTDGKEFADVITAVGAEQQRTFGISGPKTIAFSDAETEQYQQKAEEYLGRLDRVTQEFGLDEKATLAEYRRAWWDRELTNQIQKNGLELSEKEFNGLVERWADGSKKFGVKDIESDETKKWFREFEKNELPAMQKVMIRPIETTFLQAGTDSLRRVTNFLSSNNPEASAQLKRDVLEAIKAIRDSDQPDKIAKLQRELERLEGMGMDNIVPSEGVVFIYNGKPYKFTGQFAPINQITGTFKFGMAPKETDEPEQPKEPAEEKPTSTEPSPDPAQTEPKLETPPRTIAIFTGRFQPFHAGHYSIYEALVKRFGKENVYIASSDKTEAIKSPFGFKDKQEIMTRMFDIPADMIVQVKNPYSPVEILEKEPENTTYVTAVSQKDAERLGGGKYFQDFDEVPEEERKGFKEQGYFIVAPEMQLSVDGQNISGTQLRAVMGDPTITDRAKQEIFTKVYGKFDQKIFDKIVKTTTESEEARKLTAQHGEPKKRTKKKPDEKAVRRAKSVLKQKVRNPETKREILVATALTYPKNHPARKAAEALVQQAMQKNEQVLMESKKLDNLNVYVNVRDYTDEELKHEIDEYFENEKTIEAFPNLADSSHELIEMIKKAPVEVLDKEELKALENSDVGAILNGEDKTKLLKQMSDNKKDVSGLLKDIKAKKQIAMPVVIKHTAGYYLLGGNTRLSVLASLGSTMPVKVLRRSNPIDAPVSVYPQKDRVKGGKKKGSGKDLFKSLLQMRITNPETGNDIKIDTAMDYPKDHPAHTAARAVIRQRMRGLSNRAGVPKDSGPK